MNHKLVKFEQKPYQCAQNENVMSALSSIWVVLRTWCVYAVLLLNVTLFILKCVSYISQIPSLLYGSEKDLSDYPDVTCHVC